eukprot:TRINITY_DN3877_c1_g2_i7.p1 TRINITY_DN3877_c1_g2~~TRINITY_DN3877_c1_g2_i7.p1  ORF type:complete len:1452 (+),score=294.87 TRINITY_DN3877_c1_g2_i7:52-4407(+)
MLPASTSGRRVISVLGTESIYVSDDLVTSGFIYQDLQQNVKASRYVIITDETVHKLYGASFCTLVPSPQSVHIVGSGEGSKTRGSKATIEDWMLSLRCDRRCVVVAVGGGVVGDLAGFCAATYMRGVRLVHIPTTLLAMVDSSIGGKTGVNTPAGKNMIGAFHQPTRVYIDSFFLRSLPSRELRNGLAEVVKCAAICDEPLFAFLEQNTDALLAPTFASDGDAKGNSSALAFAAYRAGAAKADFVTRDEKETLGLRALLNFGHTVGHAVEAFMQPAMLHGECVAVGMVAEAEIARALGVLQPEAVGRLTRLLKALRLPLRIPDQLKTDDLMARMAVDKKNDAGSIKVVLLSAIGSTVVLDASPVDAQVIRLAISRSCSIVPQKIESDQTPSSESTSASAPISGRLRVPGSKSLSNRALLLAGLGKGECRLHGLLHSDDTMVMMDALQRLGCAQFEWRDNARVLVVHGGGGRIHAPDQALYMANAGTAMRFLTTACTLVRDGDVVLTGSQRMKERPIRDLVDSLNSYGNKVEYMERQGCPPLLIKGTGFIGGEMLLSAAVSSQFVSSVLLSAPYANSPVVLRLCEKEAVSQPYIDMTLRLMEQFGVPVSFSDPEPESETNMQQDQNTAATDASQETNAAKRQKQEAKGRSYFIPQQPYTNPLEFQIEADASSATYPLAIAAITGGRIQVDAVGKHSVQGDAGFHQFLAMMGCTVTQDEFATTVQGPSIGSLKSVEINFANMTDAFMTAAVLAAVAQGITRITGIANQRVKECNRIAAMVTELTKCGAIVSELPDGLEIHGQHPSALHGAPIHCYDDHRIAMSFAVLGCIIPGIIITDKFCVEKTYPEFWDDIQRFLQVRVVPGDQAATMSQSSLPCGSAPESHSSMEGAQQDDTMQDGAPFTVVLVGMRGAGKTTLGKTAARILDRVFVDVDHYMVEHMFKTSINEYVASYGWPAFRAQEEIAVRKILAEHPTGAVISMGGGVVESESLRTLLQDRKSCPFVVQVTRNIDEIVEYLERDLSRPKHAEHPRDTWARRKQWYRAACNYDFPIIPKDQDTEKTGLEFAHFVDRITTRGNSPTVVLSPPVSSTDSFFLSLTYSDLSGVDNLASILVGADAVELRVDLLRSHDEAFIRDQAAILRRHTSLPIIYTVRSKEQGGAFQGDEAQFLALVDIGLRLGCEFIDMETCWSLAAQKSILQRRGVCKVIASYHDRQNDWSEAEVVAAYEQCLCNGSADIAKVVFHATAVEQGTKIMSIIQSQPGAKKLPFIAVCTGVAGQMSRVLNPYFTPVTHPGLPVAAAPGQLSIRELVVTRAALKMIDGRRFYLFGGSSISASPSPVMHNAAFARYMLPFQYSLMPAEHASEYETAFKSPDFGGASVTIPHKESIASMLDVVSHHARKIGAVNTVKVDYLLSHTTHCLLFPFFFFSSLFLSFFLSFSFFIPFFSYRLVRSF